MMHRRIFLFLLGFLAFSGTARATISQVDGTIVPILENCEVWAAINHGEGFLNPPLVANNYTDFCPRTCTGGSLCLHAQRDADIYPQVFLPVRGRPVVFVDLMEQAGYENTFGWYNVGNPYTRYPIFTCTPANHEPFAQISVDFDAEYAAGRYDGGLIAFYIITPQNNTSGANCGSDTPSTNFGHIYFTETELNGDGDYVHHLVYSSRQDAERFYFAFEDLFRGGDNDFSDYVIGVDGIIPPCIPEPELCDGRDNDCNGIIDDNPIDAGGGCGTDTGECIAGVLECTGGALVCTGGTGPRAEVCDGLDNDCNGIVDDNLTDIGDPCGDDTGECAAGVTACVSGHIECAGAVGPQLETCNGLDDDCNGISDDAPVDEGAPCGTDTGECAFGTLACVAGVLVCSGGTGPDAETCNGLDDDCNGLVDDNPTDVGQACGSSTGTCQPGTTVCTGGVIQCSGAAGPQPEICDGLDNDCDGVVDDGNPGGGEPCGPQEEGQCQPGVWNCVAGRLVCEGAVLPGVEICDCADNDCNGAIDDGALCPAGTSCLNCQCVSPCQGEFCPQGMECVDGYCIPNACFGVRCATGETCVEGACVNFCDLQSCEDGFTCDRTRGVCVEDNCYGRGCPEGELCRDAACVPDPCRDVSCPAGQFCRDGACVRSCYGVSCGYRQKCVDGSCVEDPCHMVSCEAGQACVDGTCVEDPCAQVSCGTGRVCRAGACVDDPCTGIVCPQGLCEDGQCVNPVDSRPTEPPERMTTGGGCSASGAPAGADGAWWLLGGLLLLLRRRGARPGRWANWKRLALVPFLLLFAGGCERAVYEIQHPGACAQVDCEIPHAMARCEDGRCILTSCLDGYFDLDGEIENGCEYECTLTNQGVEACDGLDNNCNGAIDENTDLSRDVENCGRCGNSCFIPNALVDCIDGACTYDGCRPGFVDLDGELENGCEYACFFTNGGVEACDGLDNDCNGAIDDGDGLDDDPENCGVCGRVCAFSNASARCVLGVCRIRECNPFFSDLNGTDTDGCEYFCVPTNGGVEVCDGLDNDCNGTIDDVGTTPQDPANCGACGLICHYPHREGICDGNFQCQPGDCFAGWWDLDGDPANGCEYFCVPTNGGVEACDGLDNDCNGAIDDGNPGGDIACGMSDTGICRMGVTRCIAGQVQCIGAVNPRAETCNNLDDDCDGTVDDGNPGGGTACGTTDVGICELGTIVCQNGILRCIGAVDPQVETCNDLDDNCDGAVDLLGCQYVTGTDVRVDAATAAGQYNSIQVDAASFGGNVYVAWTDSRGASQIYFARSTNGGLSFLPEIRVYASGNNQMHPKLAVNPGNGHVYLFWEEFFSGQRDIQFSRSTDGGATFSAPVRVNSSTLDSINASLSIAPDGTLYLLHEDYREQAGTTLPYRNVYLNVSTTGGTSWGADIRVNRGNTVTSSFAMRAQGAVSTSGRYFVVFEDQRNGRPDIYLNYTDDRGATWLPSDVRISRGTPGASSTTRPQVATRDGVVYAVYEDVRDGVTSSMYLNRSLDDGVTWLSSDVLLSSGTAHAFDAALALAADGRFHVVFQDYAEGLPLIRCLTSTDQGATFASAIVDVRRGFSSTPKIVLSQLGNPVVAYLDDRDGYRDVYLNFSLDRGLSFHAFDLRMNLGVAAGTADAQGIRLVSLASGQGAGVAWFDPRTNGLQGDVFFKSTTF